MWGDKHKEGDTLHYVTPTLTDNTPGVAAAFVICEIGRGKKSNESESQTRFA